MTTTDNAKTYALEVNGIVIPGMFTFEVALYLASRAKPVKSWKVLRDAVPGKPGVVVETLDVVTE